jgi:hypothetical protein
MSHHFDTPTAREDPRINICDFYLFRRLPGTAVMAMTVNPSAGLTSPETFRQEEGIYAFKFDLNNDANEDVTFKVRFGEVTHADDDKHEHVQRFEVRRAVEKSASSGADGDLLITGLTGRVEQAPSGVKAFAGMAPDLFAGDGVALGAFRTALFSEDRFAPDVFSTRKNLFAERNVTAIVLEIPTELIGSGLVHAWATVSLYGHAPEVQVSRWGLPLVTNFFMPDLQMREDYNRATPADDIEKFSGHIEKVCEKLSRLAGSSKSPSEYAKELTRRIFPTTLPYTLDTDASFAVAAFNGRPLEDDAMDVILSLATNTTLSDGVAPDRSLTLSDFPYFGKPFEKLGEA